MEWVSLPSQPASQPAKPLGVIEPAKPLGLIEPALHFPQDCFKYHRASLTFPIGMLGIIEPALHFPEECIRYH